MNQNIIVIASIIGFIVLTSVLVFVYFQNQSMRHDTTIYCSFANDSLLNYLRNPHCARPLGVELHEDYGCVTTVDRRGYTKVECEDQNRAIIENGCLRINIMENNTVLKCPL